MPELPEVELARRELLPAMQGARFEEVVIHRPNLRTAFPTDFATRLQGHTVRALTRRGKYLLACLSSGDTLVMHLGMSGWFRVVAESGEPERHDHVVFRMSTGRTIVFNDPRRFGSMIIVETGAIHAAPGVGGLGPEPLSSEFDGAALAMRCRGRNTTLKAALSDQRVVAGLGNIYVSEALHRAGLSPKRRASTIATPRGAPRRLAHRLADAIKKVLSEALVRGERNRFRVYDREGARCLKRGCTGVVRRIAQAGRSTFFCAQCQR